VTSDRHTSPDISELDKVSFIRLNEAVTWLACGAPRTAAQDRLRVKAENTELQALIELCLAEAGAKPKYRRFPKQLPNSPLISLIARIETAPTPHPTLAKTLLHTARKLAGERETRNDQYAIALHKILEAARTTFLKLRGRQSRRADAPVERIPTAFLRGDNIAADWSGERVRVNHRPTLSRAIIAPTGELSGGYYKVELDRMQFLRHFKFATGDCNCDSKDIPVVGFDAIKKWYIETYIPPLEESGTITAESVDLSAAQAQFPDVGKLRHIIRDLRRKHRPVALRRRRGRPKKMRPE
jgi:hypothetical protein